MHVLKASPTRITLKPRAATSCNVRRFTTDCGVDILSLGSDNLYFATEEEAELTEIYSTIMPPTSPAVDANEWGREYRDLLRRILVSLESRKNYPPEGGATSLEYQNQIQAGWELVDDVSLQTLDEFEAALKVYYTEITKEKYGISLLFQFEIEAGNTLRGLL